MMGPGPLCYIQKFMAIGPLFPEIFEGYLPFFILAGNENIHNTSSKLGQNGPRTAELATLEGLEKSP